MRGHQDDATDKSTGIMDLPGNLEACRKASGTTAGTSGKRTGDKASMSEVTEILAGRQTATG